MNVYKFECVVWVRGYNREAALKELHDEVDYHFSLDNNLIALESDDGVLVEEEAEQMKTWYVTIEHTATGNRYIVPVLAHTEAQALNKASGWPYTTDAYTVINQGVSK